MRTAHFAPFVGNSLSARRHSPPPRSISPRKSALKQPNSPRDASPSDSAASDASPLVYPSPVDMAAVARKKSHRVSFDDKAVIVPQSPIPQSPSISPVVSYLPSANEALANGTTAHQPPSRSRSWFNNIGRTKKKTGDDFGTAGLDDEDVIMQPRPALPSFGSIRDKAHHTVQHEERPLIRPAADGGPPSRQPTTQAQPSPPPASKSTPLETTSTSSDHAIGSIIAAGLPGSSSAIRNTANTSRYREPLPPVVTSVDGSGYVSDSGASVISNDESELMGGEDTSNSVGEHSPVLRFDEKVETTVPTPLPVAVDFAPGAFAADATGAGGAVVAPAEPTSPTKSPRKTVPAIAITHPSMENLTAFRDTSDEEKETDAPVTESTAVTAEAVPTRAAVPPSPKKYSPVRVFFDVPGTFPPDSDSDSTAKSSPKRPAFGAEAILNEAVPVRHDAFEPITQDDDLSYSPQTPATVFATHMPTLHEESSLRDEKTGKDDSDSEVFSDAYEDLSDIEGDGFLSLDAVVESPIVPDITKTPFGTSALPGSPSPSPKTSKAEPVPSPLAKEIVPADGAPGPSDIVVSVAALAPAMTQGLSANQPGKAAEAVGEADWETVKAFWRGLTAEKRAQLENEAREDAAADGDLEEESPNGNRVRRKKSIETRIAEKRALLSELQRQEVPAEQQPTAREIKASTHPPVGDKVVAVAPKVRATSKKLRQKPKAPQAMQSEKDIPIAAVPIPVPRPKGHVRTFSADSSASSILQVKPGMASLVPSALRRRGSDSSESSFKRARSSVSGTSGVSGAGQGFRRSMRGDTNSMAPGSSRFSLRSLSPTGSTTLRGSTDSTAPQLRRTMRDGGGPATNPKRMSSPPNLSLATMRHNDGDADSSGGFFSSFGKKRGSKLLQRGKNPGGKAPSHSRFGDSSDEDDDIFGNGSPAGGRTSAARSASAGAFAFRSRFDDSSDDDSILPSRRTPGSRQDKNHAVPKTLRSAGGGSTMRSASARPASVSTPKSPPLPEELEEDEEMEARRSNTGAVYPSLASSAGPSNFADNNNNIGTLTVRRTRSGRGEMVPISPMYSPTTTGTAGNSGGLSRQHKRASSIMSVLRRRKNDGPVSFGHSGTGGGNKIQRGELMDSAARRDTQLERSVRELEAMRSSSTGSQGRRAMNKTLRSGSQSLLQDADEDSDDGEGAGVASVPIGNGGSWPLPGPSLTFESSIASVSRDKKKKKFPALRRMFRLSD